MALTSQVAAAYVERKKALTAIGFSSYESYLASDLWRRIRKKVWALRGPLCFACQGPGNQVHHDRYTRQALLGKDMKALFIVCSDCHEWAERVYGAKCSPRQATIRLKQRRAERTADRAALEALEHLRPPLDVNISAE